MADNFLENHYAEYEQKKKRWQEKKRSHLPKRPSSAHIESAASAQEVSKANQ
ncbi:MAG: hypothetical protein HUK06_01360 [Bacteroidaceae bacterium]|nr:hypothetical protein [Bacteroidaceae bacterium]